MTDEHRCSPPAALALALPARDRRLQKVRYAAWSRPRAEHTFPLAICRWLGHRAIVPAPHQRPGTWDTRSVCAALLVHPMNAPAAVNSVIDTLARAVLRAGRKGWRAQATHHVSVRKRGFFNVRNRDRTMTPDRRCRTVASPTHRGIRACRCH